MARIVAAARTSHVPMITGRPDVIVMFVNGCATDLTGHAVTPAERVTAGQLPVYRPVPKPHGWVLPSTCPAPHAIKPRCGPERRLPPSEENQHGTLEGNAPAAELWHGPSGSEQ